MLKIFNISSFQSNEAKLTCDTDENSEQLELKSYVKTLSIDSNSTLNFHNEENLGELLNFDSSRYKKLYIDALSKHKFKGAIFQMIIEIEEDNHHNLLPEPVYVPANSMNLVTPKINFSPNRPNKSKNFDLI